jgi:O-acetyl-ADP-ribose deacetylase (regulator of RNase III)
MGIPAIRIVVTKGDITLFGCDAIVNPANSTGSMCGGAALAIKIAGGESIEKEAIKKAPIAVGRAISTNPGILGAGFIIHASTMEKPSEKIPAENVEKATTAALELGNRLGAKSIAFPGMGTGFGGVSKSDAAQAMVRAIRRFINDKDGTKSLRIEKIILVGYDDELTSEFRKWTQKQDPGTK